MKRKKIVWYIVNVSLAEACVYERAFYFGCARAPQVQGLACCSVLIHKHVVFIAGMWVSKMFCL